MLCKKGGQCRETHCTCTGASWYAHIYPASGSAVKPPVPTLQVNAASIAPITASQFGTNKLMEQLITGYTGKRLTSTGKFTSTAVAGAVSALIGSPSEMIIIHQQVVHMLLLDQHAALHVVLMMNQFRWANG
jgi:hypothetical protein